MTTQAWNTRLRHDDDATFREWGLELSTKLAAAGLVQTADTGQINWATVLRVTSNTDAGYEIWRMNDAMQATAPVFFRIAYGTHTGVTGPRIQITSGTATNGAGVLSGIGGLSLPIHATASQTLDTPRQSYLCVTEGFFGLNWKTVQTVNNGEGFYAFCRTVDADGVPTALGSMQVWGNGSQNSLGRTQAFRYAAPAVAYQSRQGVGDTALCLNPQTQAGSAMGADYQAMLAWTITPAVAPLVGVCGVVATEVAQGATFALVAVGTTSHNYMAVGVGAGPAGQVAGGSQGGLRFAMLWE